VVSLAALAAQSAQTFPAAVCGRGVGVAARAGLGGAVGTCCAGVRLALEDGDAGGAAELCEGVPHVQEPDQVGRVELAGSARLQVGQEVHRGERVRDDGELLGACRLRLVQGDRDCH
jgi:hypothetical protein